METSRRGAEALEKVVAMNPDFAPAWSNLAMIYSERNETLAKALSDARRAASLVPGANNYQAQVAALQDRLSQPEKSGELAARASRPLPPAAPSAAPLGNATARTASDSGLRIERKTEPEAKASTTSTVSAAPKTAPPPAPVPPLFAESSKVYSMVGTITEVNCASTPQIQVTLKSQTITMKLHADSLEKVSIKAAGSSGATERCNLLQPARPHGADLLYPGSLESMGRRNASRRISQSTLKLPLLKTRTRIF